MVVNPAVFVSLALGWVAVSHAAVPELSGVIVLEGEARIVLIDPDTGNTSKWLNVGGDFAGYKIKDYQIDSATVVLERDETEFRVALRKPVLLAAPDKSFLLRILPDGQLALNDTPTSLPNLRQLLQGGIVTNQYEFRMAANSPTDFRVVREILGLLRENGVRRIRFETSPKPDN